MIRFFKSPQPAALFIIPVIVMVLWLPSIKQLHVVEEAHAMPVWSWFVKFISVFPAFINFLIFSAVVSLEAIYLNHVANRNEILYKNSYLPSLCFAIIASCCSAITIIHPLHLVNLLFIRAYDKIFSLYKNESPIGGLFDSGFLMAVAVLIYFPSISIFLLLLIAVPIMRSFIWREFIVVLIGFILPFFFISVYYFVVGGLSEFWGLLALGFEQFKLVWQNVYSLPLVVLAGLMTILLLFSGIKLRRNYYKNIIRTRIYQQIIFLFILFGTASFFMVSSLTPVHFAILFIPVTLFYAYYFVSAKKRLWLYDGILWLWIAVVVWNHF